MEQKKNPSRDIHRRYPLHLVAGLCASCAIVIGAFELEFQKQPLDIREPVDWDNAIALMDPEIDVEREILPAKKQPAPPPQPTFVPSIIAVAVTRDEEPAVIVQTDPFVAPDLPITSLIATPVTDEPVVVAEEMPEPIDGFGKFYRQLGRDLKYPRAAVREEIEGKVFVQFVVDREGNLTMLSVIQGLGYGCDEEAIRALIQTKWKPGRQHGLPVRVKMIIPIRFSLGK